ncbi:hypothetical protein L6R53_24820 [Myxococcota bacterium]|nr:hypothetical protein [Myxococcota bacterium]
MSIAVLVLTLLAVPGPAHAQADTTPAPPPVRVLERTVIDEHEFRELQVDGKVTGPSLVLSTERSVRGGTTWIALRSDFSREMSASVAEID